MSRNKLITFAVFKNLSVGEKVKALDFDDLIENRMTKRQLKFWSNIKFLDSEDRTINVNREFLEEQGMSFNECVLDWIEHNPELLNDSIHTI